MGSISSAWRRRKAITGDNGYLTGIKYPAILYASRTGVFEMNENVYTDFLVSKGSFMGGAGSVLNLSGNYFLYDSSETPEQADERAIRSDWEQTGNDIATAMGKIPATR